MYINEIGSEHVDWIHLAKDRAKCRNLVKIKREIFFTRDLFQGIRYWNIGLPLALRRKSGSGWWQQARGDSAGKPSRRLGRLEFPVSLSPFVK
jgi:hypothetical protein